MGNIDYKIAEDGTIIRINEENTFCKVHLYWEKQHVMYKFPIQIDDVLIGNIHSGTYLEAHLERGMHNIKIRHRCNFIMKTDEINIDVKEVMVIIMKQDRVWSGQVKFSIPKG